MYERAGKIDMPGNMGNGVENGNPGEKGDLEQDLNNPKAKGRFTKSRIANASFFLLNVVILIIHSFVATWGENPGVDTKILNHKYPMFLDIIKAHKSTGTAEDQECKSESTCKLSLSDLVKNMTIHPTGVTTVKYEDQTLWNYYLNTVIRNQYETVDTTTGKCLTGVCGNDKGRDGTSGDPCKWCDFNFGNSTASYSIKECDDEIKDRRLIYLVNMGLHLLAVIVCGGLLSYMPKDTQYDTYIRCLIWLTASLYLVGNFGYLSIMLVKDHDGHNVCAEILTGRSVRFGAIAYIVLSALYFIGTLLLLSIGPGGRKTVHREKAATVAYALMPRV